MYPNQNQGSSYPKIGNNQLETHKTYEMGGTLAPLSRGSWIF